MTTNHSTRAEELAIKHWSAITAVIHKHFTGDLQAPMLAFAETVWLLAFESGHARGIEAIHLRPELREPKDPIQYLKDAIENALHATACARRAHALPAELGDAIFKMLQTLQTASKAIPSGTPFAPALASSVDHAMAAGSRAPQLIAANDTGAEISPEPAN